LIQGLIWSGAIVAFLFLIFRLFVRIHTFRRLFLDDLLTTAAWLMLLGQAIIWQTQLEAMYEQVQLAIGKLAPTAEVMERNAIFSRAELLVLFLFYSCLWSIKGSFLVFFWRIGANLRPYKIWFWCVLAFTIASYAISVGDIQYPCLLMNEMWDHGMCVRIRKRGQMLTTTTSKLRETSCCCLRISDINSQYHTRYRQ
jgi:hypothetical protein